MKEGAIIGSHVSEFNSISPQLRSSKVNLDEEVLCLLLLSSSPASWDILVTTVTNTIGNKFNLKDVVASLLNEWTRKASTQMLAESNQALAAGDRGRTQHRDQHYGFNKGKSHNRGRSKSQGKKVTYWYCKKPGHTRKDWYALKSKQKAKGKDDHVEASTVSDNEDGVTFSIACTTLSIADTWVLDSGTSFYVCPKRSYFSSYTDVDGGLIYLGGDRVCKILGIRNVVIKQLDRKKHILINVKSVPELKKILLSTGQLEDFGFIVTFENEL
ncbi:uncharacterized protein LOC110007532 [Amborella trichopoda]|uniref:uncharacterized protein LOC110007532 n=1 Tax=Amborella trichopoda TaxID=13333 RepID=UPI0009BE9099|nr:uncharacterized protein LOC110007532 [Amborella trichopoda]XP_020524651.1 uncharacterized protein LOC110007532 [Amborella trichopoda]XP_020524652.1 uncharacterized protein LOC110007532 [Amborella trichopoda]|eukprot:XP_020524650.1 uncharacterized protein LOC110007532 [Amborella trichopoda]